MHAGGGERERETLVLPSSDDDLDRVAGAIRDLAFPSHVLLTVEVGRTSWTFSTAATWRRA